jgi:hypothetical protein
MKTITSSVIILASLSMFIFGGCSNSTTSQKTGELQMFLADSPAQYDAVNIVVTKVEVHSAGSDSLSGWATIRNDTVTFNLLRLQNGVNVLLGDAMLPAGQYTQIRLSIGSGSNVVVNGTPYTLDISSATGLKLNNEFSIMASTLYLLTLDFDAAHSILQTGNGQYKLKPVIRVEANDSVGTISGIVLPVAVRAEAMTVSGSDTVTAFCDTTSGAFKLAILPAGTYNVFISTPNLSYSDTTVTGVVVTRQQDTNIGTVTLHQLP